MSDITFKCFSDIKLSILAHDHTGILKISMIISFWNKICECWEEGIHSSNGIMSTNNLVTCTCRTVCGVY